MKLRYLTIAMATAATAAFACGAALADPPDRVGRISDIEGTVSLQPPQEDFWTDASVNFPVAAGEAFWTGDDGRAELEIGAVEARLDNLTELDIVDVDYGQMRLGLTQGSVNLKLFATPTNPVTISTPAGDVLIQREGFYRVDVGAPSEDGSYQPVEVTVFDGAAEAPGEGGFVQLADHQAAVAYAGADPQLTDVQEAPVDDWARARLAQERWSGQTAVPIQLTGFQDLYSAGQFVGDAQYGQVWFPNEVPADWAPYRYGHWAYVAPWGYTWIDDQRWGFAPFHYGRWVRVEGRWGWVPGRQGERPVYAPALVAFVGGGGWSVGLEVGGGGAIGWVPLGPEEVYRPSYAVSGDYVRRVNVTNVTRITDITNVRVTNITTYRNATAATVVRSAAFSGGAPVTRAKLAVSAEALARAPVAAAATPPPPTRAARAGAVAGSGGEIAPPRAAPPPARLAAVRTAVVSHPPGVAKAPPIAGVHAGPPRPPEAQRAPIAPAQARSPARARPPVGAAEERAVRPAMEPKPAPVAKTAPAAASPPKTAPGAKTAPAVDKAKASAKARDDAAKKRRQENPDTTPTNP